MQAAQGSAALASAGPIVGESTGGSTPLSSSLTSPNAVLASPSPSQVVPAGAVIRDKHGNLVDEARGVVTSVSAALLSRLLYSNPVCLLTTSASMMTISWLTPIDNTVRPPSHMCRSPCITL